MSEVDESKPHLRCLLDGKVYNLEGEMIVGRLAECSIVLDNEQGASRRHASFAVVDQDVFVTDLGSLNGTLVNGVEIKEKSRLSDGDILVFDKNEYKVSIPVKNEEPEFDPNVTVFVNRDDMLKQQESEAAIDLTDETKKDIDLAALEEFDSAAEKQAPVDTSPQEFPDLAPSAKPAEPVPPPVAEIPPAPEPPAAEIPPAPEPPAAEIPSAPPMQAEAPPAPTPQPVVEEPQKPAAIQHPRSWAGSADVFKEEGTMLAPGVVEMNAMASQVDLSSISEPSLVVQTGDDAGTLMPLHDDRTEWSIGSSDDRNLKIAHTGVSGNHAAIVQEGSKWKVIDQMSINGTFVNGDRVNVRYINSEDVLRFGPIECKFVVPGGYASKNKSSKGSRAGISPWKIAIPVLVLLIVGGAYYAYTSGMLTNLTQ
ncbi:MAG: FHA domain-containing protein [Granulosicoccus sp.]